MYNVITYFKTVKDYNKLVLKCPVEEETSVVCW